MIAKLRARVLRGRLVLEVEGQPPVVLGAVVVCPRCGAGFMGGASCP